VSDRYFAKVVHIQDKYTVVINAGTDRGVVIGKKFLVIGLGEVIVDPETKEELERLEVVRGHAQVTHVQGKIATLRSSEYEKMADEREIKKVTSRGGVAIFGMPEDVVTETTRPGEQRLREFKGVQVGDLAIAV